MYFFVTICKLFAKCFRVPILMIASQAQTKNYVDQWVSIDLKMFGLSCLIISILIHEYQHKSTRVWHESTRVRRESTRVKQRVSTNQHDSDTS